MKKILIFGGCVSRDAIEYLDEHDELKLLRYFARSSFASLAAEPYVQEDVLGSLTSKFQRAVVAADMRKEFLRTLETEEFDILLMDLIGQRYSILMNEEGGGLTISIDYKKAKKERMPGDIILAKNTPRYIRLWRNGLRRIADILEARGYKDRVRVSELYWSTLGAEGKTSGLFRQELVDRENKYLKERYSDIVKVFGSSVLIRYPQEMFHIDLQHKWGQTPYHYTHPLYEETVRQLREFVN